MLYAVPASERRYQGNAGYDDDPQLVYRYDSFVPNHKNLAVGDTILLRDQDSVRGSAVIEAISKGSGTKARNLCPTCGASSLKERRTLEPRFRCECGAEFEVPDVRDEPCTLFEAVFGDTFQELEDEISVADLWKAAPRLNKQLAILELDAKRVSEMLALATGQMGRGDQPTIAAREVYVEGTRIAVLVNRYERDRRARRDCISHFGARCQVCGFSFAERYGALGDGVIEVHHIEPLSATDQDVAARTIDPIRDLRPLCSNCHTMIHQRNPPFTLEELRAVLGPGPSQAAQW